ncbi:MAG: protein kinase [Planctomycetes bacterium]|nr:protein kinase [Planctomycetota bacterium]
MDTTRASGEWRTTSSSGEWGLRLQPGAVVGGFVLEQKLGHGGMGAVFVGRALGGEQRVAIKVLLVGGDELRPEEVERFRREGQAQAAADAHPNILRVITSGDHLGHPFLVTELAPGGDLKARLRQGPLAPADAAALVAALARGMAHAHARGVLHRDLKPANVVFGEDDAPKVMDFGLARLAGAQKLTQTGAAIGTAAYMAPEQAAGERLDERVDVYGLGAILYECLVGQAPFAGGSEIAIIKQVLADPVRPPRSLRPDVPAALEAIALRALAKDPAARHPTASALAEDLERFADGGAGPAGRRWRRVVLGLAVAAALVVGAGVVVALRPGDRAPSAPEAAPETATSRPRVRGPLAVRLAAPADWQLVAGEELEVLGDPTGEVTVVLLGPGDDASALAPVASALPARVLLPVGWSTLVVETSSPGRGTKTERRHVVRLPAGMSTDPEGRAINDADGSVLVLVPPGPAKVREDPLRAESPLVERAVERPFLIGRHEVTWAQVRRWEAEQGREPLPHVVDVEGRLHEAGPDEPAFNVLPAEAQEYCDWAGLRLPTLLEWTYAAAGKDGHRYPWGPGPAPDGPGWEAAPRANVRSKGVRLGPKPVGSFPDGRSPLGLDDMVGNVWEWVAPFWHGGVRVVANVGGGWSNGRDKAGCYVLVNEPMNPRSSNTGLRVAASVDPAR